MAKMPPARDIVYYLFHSLELRAIIQWQIFHTPVHERDERKDSHNLKECYQLLKLSSRSFVAVVQELHPELLVPVCIFYLVLRGLDTIEDDMTISLEEKEPLLRYLYTHIDDESWTYNGNGPEEKDREVLVRFDCVTREFNKIKDEYKAVIRDITKRMGNGMADFAIKPDANGIKTIKDCELYCHYVAGLLGEGLTQLFVEAKLANPALLQKPELMESMGQLLQQTNIIRDVREDYDDMRYWWPAEVWSKYVDRYSDLFLPQNREKTLQCSGEMVLMALNRVTGCLSYMADVEEQSVFNFVAIPQAMAIATLELCFQNPAIFDRNVKITKGSACQIMIESTQNLHHVYEIFRRHVRKIQEKNSPSDAHYHDISLACMRIQRFVESNSPPQTQLTKLLSDSRTVDVNSDGEADKKAQEVKSKKDVMNLALAIFATLGVIVALIFGTR